MADATEERPGAGGNASAPIPVEPRGSIKISQVSDLKEVRRLIAEVNEAQAGLLEDLRGLLASLRAKREWVTREIAELQGSPIASRGRSEGKAAPTESPAAPAAAGESVDPALTKRKEAIAGWRAKMAEIEKGKNRPLLTDRILKALKASAEPMSGSDVAEAIFQVDAGADGKIDNFTRRVREILIHNPDVVREGTGRGTGYRLRQEA